MRMILGLVLAACSLVLPATAGSVRAASRTWYLTLESAVGRSTMSYETAIGTYAMESRTVFRQSIAPGRTFGQHMTGGIELSWVQRGATEHIRTVFRPEEQAGSLSFERTYVDVGVPISYCFGHGRASLAAGLSPRISFLASSKSSPIPATYDHGPLLGVDPHVAVGYRALRLTARYLVDVVRPQDTSVPGSPVSITDKVFFLGLGWNVAL